MGAEGTIALPVLRKNSLLSSISLLKFSSYFRGAVPVALQCCKLLSILNDGKICLLFVCLFVYLLTQAKFLWQLIS